MKEWVHSKESMQNVTLMAISSHSPTSLALRAMQETELDRLKEAGVIPPVEYSEGASMVLVVCSQHLMVMQNLSTVLLGRIYHHSRSLTSTNSALMSFSNSTLQRVAASPSCGM